MTMINFSALAASAINAAQGRFVSVTFVKADGSVRTINGRTGVKKHLKGGRNTNAPESIVLWSGQDGYRQIKPERILSVSVDGMTMASRTLEQFKEAMAS